jgi:hypothetical protein
LLVVYKHHLLGKKCQHWVEYLTLILW